MSIRVLVTGASGFVGSRLTTALVAAGHQVRAMTRHPDTYSGSGEPVFGDVSDSDSLRAAMMLATARGESLEDVVGKLLGQPWDDELETFRWAGEGAPVRWLHQVV